GACDGSFDYTCTVTMDQARNVSAAFADDTPPTPAIHTPAGLGSPAVATFDEPVHGVTASDLVVRVEGRTTGQAASVECLDQEGRTTSCANGEVIRALVQPVDPL